MPRIMDSSFLEIVREWAGSMEGADKVNFSFLSMQDMGALINIPLKRDLLRAAASFWDPIRHVFVFNSQELCPTVEEFRTISASKYHMFPYCLVSALVTPQS